MSDIREDKQRLQSMICTMGNAIAAILPAGWTKVVAGYFAVDQNETPHLQLHVVSGLSGDYADLMDASWDCDEFDDAITEVQQICREMRRMCSAVNDNWTSMTFSMLADGSFHIDYGYDFIEAYDSVYILKWQSQYLD